MRAGALVLAVAACGSHPSTTGADAPSSDGAAADAMADAPAVASGLGTASNPTTATCGTGAPAGATCTNVTVTGCPGIESESITAQLAFLAQTGTLKGTIVHFSGGGGNGFEVGGGSNYQTAGFQQVFVSWVGSAWEQTASSGILAAACRPATIVKYVFDTTHAGSRTAGFCGQGFSGGSGQLAYALAHYGMGAYLDYVNEEAGPPFARIDLGCQSTTPAATVCGATDTMALPAQLLNAWENTTTCGTASPPAADIAKWNADSVLVGGTYTYPNTRVEFFDCTTNATAVTAMAQLYYNDVVAAEGGTTNTAYHCYAQCNGEALGTTGQQDSIAALIAGCTPRH